MKRLPGKLLPVEKTVQRFTSHAEADRADREYYRSLTPQQRVDLTLELVRQYRESLPPDEQRFKRVHRIVTLEES